MKSDREFIEGIYEKARIYEEPEVKKADFGRKLLAHRVQLTAAACVLLMIGGAAYLKKNWVKVITEDPSEKIAARAAIEPETQEDVVRTKEIAAVLGEIIQVNTQDTDVQIDILTQEVNGEASSQEMQLRVSTGFYDELCEYLEEEEKGDLTGQRILACLIPYNFSDYYTVDEERQGLYFEETRNGELVYTNIDNVTADKEQLMENFMSQ